MKKRFIFYCILFVSLVTVSSILPNAKADVTLKDDVGQAEIKEAIKFRKDFGLNLDGKNVEDIITEYKNNGSEDIHGTVLSDSEINELNTRDITAKELVKAKKGTIIQ